MKGGRVRGVRNVIGVEPEVTTTSRTKEREVQSTGDERTRSPENIGLDVDGQGRPGVRRNEVPKVGTLLGAMGQYSTEREAYRIGSVANEKPSRWAPVVGICRLCDVVRSERVSATSTTDLRLPR